MPVVASDSFTGTAGASINNRAATGGTWNTAAGSNAARIGASGHNLSCTAAGGVLGRMDLGATGHWTRLTALVFGSVNTAGPAVRTVDASNFISVRAVSATTVEIFKRVGSTTDQVVATITGLSLTLPVTLELQIVGTTVTAMANGEPIGLAGGYTVADTALQSSTRGGLWVRGAIDPIADEWAGGTPDAGGPVAVSPASARQAQRADAVALAASYTLGPAGGGHAQRAGGASLAMLSGIAPAPARHPQRAQAAVLATGVVLATQRARHGQRAGTAAIAVAATRVAIETKVPVETRVERATRP